jgi:hypothetical protein
MDMDGSLTNPPDVPGSGDNIPVGELYMPFEGLGNNCEFGIVQRLAGYDPPGLFRNVGYLRADAMISLIENNLAGMFDEGAYKFVKPDGWPDYRLDCLRYGFFFHTAIPATLEQDSAAWQRKAKDAVASFRFLKRLFQDDLKTGEKTFVFRFIEPLEPRMQRQFLQAIRKHGPGWLLYIRQDPAYPEGFVELAEDGLLIGAIDKLSNENPPQINAKAWEHIARKAIDLRRRFEARS